MQAQLDELTRLNDEMQRHMDRFAGLLKTAYANPNPATMRLLREVSRDMNHKADLVNEKLAALQERNRMKRINVLAVFLIGLMIFVTSFAVAQDSALETNTPQTVEGTEQPPVVDDPVEEAPAPTESRLLVFIERVFPWLMATFMTLLVIGGVLGREAIVTIGRSAPAVGREAIISAGESLIGSLERGAATTEITLDDAAVAELKKLFVSIVEDIRASEAKSMMLKQMATQEAAESSIATPDPWKLQYPADHMGSHG